MPFILSIRPFFGADFQNTSHLFLHQLHCSCSGLTTTFLHQDLRNSLLTVSLIPSLSTSLTPYTRWDFPTGSWGMSLSQSRPHKGVHLSLREVVTWSKVLGTLSAPSYTQTSPSTSPPARSLGQQLWPPCASLDNAGPTSATDDAPSPQASPPYSALLPPQHHLPVSKVQNKVRIYVFICYIYCSLPASTRTTLWGIFVLCDTILHKVAK